LEDQLYLEFLICN